MVRPVSPSEFLRRAVAETLRDDIVSWTAVSGGYSSAGLWVVATGSGTTLFVKAATSEDTARFLRDEAGVYREVVASFMPRLEAWVDDGERPFLILEDLSGLHWPPPWSRADVEAVLAVCSSIATSSPPSSLGVGARPALAQAFWPGIAASPEAVHALDIAAPSWLEHAMPLLIEAEDQAVLDGEALVHADIRSDNLCVGAGVKVIDWNWAFVGNPMVDLVGWLPSLHLEGGPAPWELLAGEAPLVARLTGFFVQHATLPPRSDVTDGVRALQRAQGAVGLQWVARELGIRPPSVA